MPHNSEMRKKLQNVRGNMFTSTPVRELNVCNVKGSPDLVICIFTPTCGSQNKMAGMKELGKAAMLSTRASQNMPGTAGVI